MAHRDELTAAQARIESLERELAEARAAGENATEDVRSRAHDDLSTARARIRELEDSVRVSDQRYDKMRSAKYELQERVTELEREVVSLKKRLVEKKAEADQVRAALTRGSSRRPVQAGAGLLTLRAYSEALEALDPFEAAEEVEPAGVWCTDCARAGRSVELVFVLSAFELPGTDARMTLCLNCGGLAVKRPGSSG